MQIKLQAPITVKQKSSLGPVYRKPNGQPVLRSEHVFTELNITIVKDAERKSVRGYITGVPLHLTLWKGDDFDIASEYTEEQVKDRVLEILGDNPTAVLEKLFYSALPEY
jgi:hypothetical protein